MKVSEAIARAIVGEGVESIFALMGDTNLHIFGALARLDGPKIYNALHEQAAVAMGEGYARSTGKPALCMVTAGPGLMNAMTPLTNAARSETPLVIITGQHSRDDLTSNQWLDHEGTVRMTGARYRPVASPDVAIEAFQTAFYTARAYRCPVVLDVPLDVQQMDYPWPIDYASTTERLKRSQRIHPDPALVAEAVDSIRAAKRPVVLGGRGLVASGARKEAIALAAAIDGLLGTTLLTRGMFFGERGNIGVAGLFSSRVACELFAQADCVIAAGASLNSFTIEGGYLFPNAQIVQIDLRDETVMGNDRRADVYIQGDAKATLQALTSALNPNDIPVRGFATEAAEALTEATVDPVPYELEPGRADPREICSTLDDALSENTALCMDGGHFWSFPIMHMQRWRWPQVYAYQFGAIGIGLPTAIGTALAIAPRPTVFVGGDLGTMLNIHELATMARYSPPLLAVILNDAALGAEYHKLMAHDYDPMLGAEPDFDFAGIARSFGVQGVKASKPEDLVEAVHRFQTEMAPLVVDVKVSRSVRSQTYRRLHFAEDD